MEIKLLNFAEDTIETIFTLRRKVELREGSRTRATRTIEDLIELIKIAESSHAHDVIEALAKFIHCLDEKQITFFSTLGLDLMADAHHNELNHVNYRGAHIADPIQQEKEIHHGKRKMMYRGQERWV